MGNVFDWLLTKVGVVVELKLNVFDWLLTGADTCGLKVNAFDGLLVEVDVCVFKPNTFVGCEFKLIGGVGVCPKPENEKPFVGVTRQISRYNVYFS